MLVRWSTQSFATNFHCDFDVKFRFLPFAAMKFLRCATTLRRNARFLLRFALSCERWAYFLFLTHWAARSAIDSNLCIALIVSGFLAFLVTVKVTLPDLLRLGDFGRYLDTKLRTSQQVVFQHWADLMLQLFVAAWFRNYLCIRSVRPVTFRNQLSEKDKWL